MSDTIAKQDGSGSGGESYRDIKHVTGNLTLSGTIELPVQYNTNADPSHAQHNSKRKHTRFEITTKIIEIFVAAVVGGSLVCISLFTYWVYDEQTKDAFAAERAYIFVSKINIQHPVMAGSKITIDFKNFGNTPAIIDAAPSACNYFSVLPPAILDEEAARKLAPKIKIVDFTTLVIGGGGDVGSLNDTVDATSDEIAKAGSGDGSVRCIFNVNYADVRSNRHVGGICLSYVPVGGGGFIFCREKQYHYTDN
ncbi:MAG TPA: hypothetical protein VHW90_08245 [Stellaceae bacterium]|jgi:hypothetical protein|nr:hypothetical protein [Stellaceae bacterium]